MLKIIDDLPEYVFGLRAIGDVSGDEIKNILIPGLEALTEKFDEIYYILVLETKVKNFSAGAWVRDMITSLKHFTKWKKIAIVTNQTAVKKFADAFNYVSPGYAKGFSPNDLEEAIIWVSLKL